MPAKFDRCVRKVKASLKKARRKGNAYAICTAAMKHNPIPMGVGGEHAVNWKPLLIIIGAAAAVGVAIAVAAKPAQASTPSNTHQQGGPALPPDLPPPPGETYAG